MTNQTGSYGAVTKALHWLTVLLVAIQFVVAYVMPHVHRGTKAVGLLAYHAAFGILILALGIVWVLWRLTHASPHLTGIIPTWQVWASRLAQGLLYLLLLVVPILGWLAGSMRGWVMSLFGIVPVPALAPVNDQLAGRIGDLHAEFAWYGMGILALIHIAAALYHHFVRHDEVLRRMLPHRSR